MKRRNFLVTSSLTSLSALLMSNSMFGATRPDSVSQDPANDISFWDLFVSDYRLNCKMWKHNIAKNPVIPAGTNLWNKFWTANPGLLQFKGDTLVYYRGNGVTPINPDRHDRLAVVKIKTISADDLTLQDLTHGQFIVDVGEKGTFDDTDVLDPSPVIFKDKVFLYYSAVGVGPNAVGLAISEDGIHFKKHCKVMTGRAPSAVVVDDKIFMIYQKDLGKGYRGFYLAVSTDGINFGNHAEETVLNGEEKGWDNFIATARIYKEQDHYILIYGGSPDLNDQPDYFGIAKSKDMVHWEKHPGNPVFGLGAKGEEDGGAMWFPALIDIKTHFVMLYEGSRGRYAWDLSSQICMASIKKILPG